MWKVAGVCDAREKRSEVSGKAKARNTLLRCLCCWLAIPGCARRCLMKDERIEE